MVWTWRSMGRSVIGQVLTTTIRQLSMSARNSGFLRELSLTKRANNSGYELCNALRVSAFSGYQHRSLPCVPFQLTEQVNAMAWAKPPGEPCMDAVIDQFAKLPSVSPLIPSTSANRWSSARFETSMHLIMCGRMALASVSKASDQSPAKCRYHNA